MKRPTTHTFIGLAIVLAIFVFFVSQRLRNPSIPSRPSDRSEPAASSARSDRSGEPSSSDSAITFKPPSPATGKAGPSPVTDEREIGVRLQEWLTSSPDTAAIAGRIAREFPTVKREDQATVARELIPLVTDDVYASRMPGIVLDPKVSPDAHRLFFRDLTLRSDEVGLPLLLEIAKLGDSHPQAAEAKIRLALRFGGDPESSWEAWQPYVTEELARRKALLQLR